MWQCRVISYNITAKSLNLLPKLLPNFWLKFIRKPQARFWLMHPFPVLLIAYKGLLLLSINRCARVACTCVLLTCTDINAAHGQRFAFNSLKRKLIRLPANHWWVCIGDMHCQVHCGTAVCACCTSNRTCHPFLCQYTDTHMHILNIGRCIGKCVWCCLCWHLYERISAWQ